MSSAAEMSLKAKLKNFAKAKQLKPQTVVQNFMFERLLERLAKSEYRDHFIIKGGILISSMVGIATRSTMDMDATVVGLKLTIRNVRSVMERIADIPCGIRDPLRGDGSSRSLTAEWGCRCIVALGTVLCESWLVNLL